MRFMDLLPDVHAVSPASFLLLQRNWFRTLMVDRVVAGYGPGSGPAN